MRIGSLPVYATRATTRVAGPYANGVNSPPISITSVSVNGTV